jgi:acyl-CoA thioester hydrolase
MATFHIHSLPIRIYYEDTDFSGVVYHASYLRFLERGRTEWLRELGVHQSALHGNEDALAFAVRRMTIDWLKPAKMDDMITVETKITQIRGASLVLYQRIVMGEIALLTAEVLVALVQNGKPARLTQALQAKLHVS